MTDITTQIAAGESTHLEFKSTMADSRRIIETIAAMATVGGGTLLVGVRDDGRIVGAQPGAGEVERLVQQVLANTDPRIYIDIDWPDTNGLRLLRICVPPGDGPHLAFGRAFFRSDRVTVAMSRDEYERRLLDRLREAGGYERRVEPDTGLTDIDPGSVADFATRTRMPHDASTTVESPETLLQRLHLLAQGQPTVGALLLFGRKPQRAFPQATIRARAERGTVVDASDVGGCLFRQIEDAVGFVGRNLRHRPRITELVREDVPELPMDAIREVVANAVAHRDYRSTAPTQLTLSDTGLEVWNPGHLPAPLTPASLRVRHPSIPTNPRIARALYLAGFIEEWGTGTLRVIDTMRANGNPEPIFEAPEGGVRVVLPLPGSQAGLIGTPRADALAQIPRGKPFRSADFANAAGVSIRTAAQDLTRLGQLGFVRRVGQGKATRWVRM